MSSPGSDVLVCVGAGGVGKTTTAAALALREARRGRRTVVLTIDPARRLAETLAAGALGNDPRPVAGGGFAIPGGELWAAMLDPAATFDDLVRRHAAHPHQAEEILANPLYRTLSTSSAGVQELMAMEKLLELHEDPRFDVVVVDTPPSAHVLALLESPQLLDRLFASWLYRTLVPTNRAVRLAAGVVQGVVRPLTRVVGAAVVDQAVGFFRAFEGMEAGFRRRSERTLDVLRGDRTSFVLVTAPRSDAVAEALGLAAELGERGVPPTTVVVNLVQRRHAGPATDPVALAAELAGSPWEAAARALAEAERRRRTQDEVVAPLVERLGVATVHLVPDLGDGVGIDAVADELG